MSDEMTEDDGPPEMVAAYNAYAKGAIRWELAGDEAFIAGWHARGAASVTDEELAREVIEFLQDEERHPPTTGSWGTAWVMEHRLDQVQIDGDVNMIALVRFIRERLTHE